MGIIGDAATATPAATSAPAAAATATSVSPAAISCERVIPSAASTGLSGDAYGQQEGGGLADDQQRGDRKDQRKDGQRYRLGPDCMLNGRSLRALVCDHYGTPGVAILARECLRPLPERGWGGSRPQFDIRSARAYVLHAEPVEQRRAGEHDRDPIVLGNGEDRPASDHDADHPLTQQAGTGRTGTGLLAILASSPHGQHAAHLQAHHGRRALVGCNLIGVACGRQPPGEHLRDINKPPEPPVDRRDAIGPLAPRAPWPSGATPRTTIGATARAPGRRARASKKPCRPGRSGATSKSEAFEALRKRG